MLRLAVFDLPSSFLNEIGARLRGATLHAGDESAFNEYDAIVCGTSKLDIARIDSLRQQDKRLFLLVDAVPNELLADPFASDKRIMLVNPERYLPSRQLIRQQLDAGKLGEPGLLRIHRWEPAPFRMRDLDLILGCFGQAPNFVYAVENAWCTQIQLGFPTGGMALLGYATHLPKGDTYYSVSLIGAHGAAYADDHANMQLVYQGGSPRAIRSDETIAQWTAMLQAFVVAYDSDRVARETGSESYPTWRRVLAINQAIDQSLQTKQSVVLEGVR